MKIFLYWNYKDQDSKKIYQFLKNNSFINFLSNCHNVIFYKEFRDFEVDLTPYLVKEYGDDWASNYNEYAMSLLKGDDGEYYAVPLGLSISIESTKISVT